LIALAPAHIGEARMKKKILVIDDSRTARQQVAAALVDGDYQIVEAVDGREGLTQFAAHPDTSLVICDVNMPNLNGLEFLTTVRADSPQSTVPIIMLTTEAELDLVTRAKAAGARGWIVKPFKPHMLLAAVRKLTGDG
jgi:two-component system chemotaxis response regulator CheY